MASLSKRCCYHWWEGLDQRRSRQACNVWSGDLGKEADPFLSLKWLPEVRSHSVLQPSWLYSRRLFLNVICDVSACRSAHIYQRLTMCRVFGKFGELHTGWHGYPSVCTTGLSQLPRCRIAEPRAWCWASYFLFHKYFVPFSLEMQACLHACQVASVMSDYLQPHGPWPTRLLCPDFSRQEYWSRLSCPPWGNLLDPGTEPSSHVSCIGRWILYHLHNLGSPNAILDLHNV